MKKILSLLPEWAKTFEIQKLKNFLFWKFSPRQGSEPANFSFFIYFFSLYHWAKVTPKLSLKVAVRQFPKQDKIINTHLKPQDLIL